MTDLYAVKVQLQSLEKKLDQLVAKVDQITATTGVLDVHDQRLAEVESKVSALWSKWETIAGQDGVISRIRNQQASCPRAQLRWVWIVLIPMALTLLAVAAAVIKTNFGG